MCGRVCVGGGVSGALGYTCAHAVGELLDVVLLVGTCAPMHTCWRLRSAKATTHT